MESPDVEEPLDSTADGDLVRVIAAPPLADAKLAEDLQRRLTITDGTADAGTSAEAEGTTTNTAAAEPLPAPTELVSPLHQLLALCEQEVRTSAASPHCDQQCCIFSVVGLTVKI